jgi:hypothetical protein
VNDPLSIGRLPRDDSDMMAPDNNHANAGAAGVHAFTGPRARQRKTPIRSAEIFAQVASAPGVCAMAVMPVMGTGLGLNGKHEQNRRRDSEGF